MKKIATYIYSVLSLIMLVGVSSCSKNDGSEPEGPLPPYMEEDVQMRIGSDVFTLSLFDNQTGRAFRELLPLTVSMDDVNANEKFIRLSQNLPTAAVNPANIRTGHLMLYGSDGLVLFYKSFPTSYSYTRVGTVDNPSGLESALGAGAVNITFFEQARPRRATLSYNTNGADIGATPDPVTEDVGTPMTLNNGDGFSRTGYSFAGWNTRADGSGTRYAGGGRITLTADITLYAQWRAQSTGNLLTITIGSSRFTAALESNPTAEAFKALMPLTVQMDDVNANEKFIRLPQDLPTAPTNPGTIHTGDLMLYGSDGLVMFYKSFTTSYSYTRIGRVANPSGLEAALGSGSVTVSFTLDAD